MSDYISREELIKECIRYGNHEHNIQFKPDVSERRKHDSDVAMYMCEHFKKFAEKLPSADVRENIHGKWIEQNSNRSSMQLYECSICKYWSKDYSPFCPNCGCSMKGE
jgi:hypothetical protein